MRPIAIVNPRAGNWRAGKHWPEVERRLRQKYSDLQAHLTSRPHEATEITRQSILQGFDLIIAMGGDGTINEVVNGFFDDDRSISERAILGIIPDGTGSDFARSINLPSDPMQAVERIIQGTPRPVDVGRIRCKGIDGSQVTRYFVNIADFGFGGAVANFVNGSTKVFGGFLTFLGGLLTTLVTYQNAIVHLRVDETLDEDMTINSVNVANGQFFGGGMWVAPEARIDDGLFEIVIVGDVTRAEVLTSTPLLYRGKLGQHPKVKVLRGRRIEVSAAQEVLLEADGETPGKLPALFEMLPKAIRILV